MPAASRWTRRHGRGSRPARRRSMARRKQRWSRRTDARESHAGACEPRAIARPDEARHATRCVPAPDAAGRAPAARRAEPARTIRGRIPSRRPRPRTRRERCARSHAPAGPLTRPRARRQGRARWPASKTVPAASSACTATPSTKAAVDAPPRRAPRPSAIDGTASSLLRPCHRSTRTSSASAQRRDAGESDPATSVARHSDSASVNRSQSQRAAACHNRAREARAAHPARQPRAEPRRRERGPHRRPVLVRAAADRAIVNALADTPKRSATSQRARGFAKQPLARRVTPVAYEGLGAVDVIACTWPDQAPRSRPSANGLRTAPYATLASRATHAVCRRRPCDRNVTSTCGRGARADASTRAARQRPPPSRTADQQQRAFSEVLHQQVAQPEIDVDRHRDEPVAPPFARPPGADRTRLRRRSAHRRRSIAGDHRARVEHFRNCQLPAPTPDGRSSSEHQVDWELEPGVGSCRPRPPGSRGAPRPRDEVTAASAHRTSRSGRAAVES